VLVEMGRGLECPLRAGSGGSTMLVSAESAMKRLIVLSFLCCPDAPTSEEAAPLDASSRAAAEREAQERGQRNREELQAYLDRIRSEREERYKEAREEASRRDW